MPDSMTGPFTFTCSVCGDIHIGVPDLGFDAPWYYHQLSAEQKIDMGDLTSDTCVISGKDFFIRGCLELPVIGHPEPFAYGVWVSLSQANYERYVALFESTARHNESPYFGWLCNNLPDYPATLSLKTHVHLRPYPLRPRIELEATDHPLAREQRNGISTGRLREILEANEHPRHTA